MNDRRTFLAQSGALIASPLLGARRAAAAAPPWLAFRPAAFDVANDSATIWVCTDEQSTVRIQYSAGERWEDAKLSESVNLTSANGFTGTSRLQSLRAGTRYRYRITDASGTPRDADFATGAFGTAPEADRDFSFAFSGDTHARYKPFAIFDHMLERKPDFFIHLGDTVYADSPRDRFQMTLPYYRMKHREIRADQHLQRFLASVPTYAIWDDHEVENDFTASHPGIPIGRQAFLEFWPLVNGGADATVLYRRFKWSPSCEFFVLDTRQYRDQGESGAGVGKTLLGTTQLQWLKAGLKASTAQFKFLCSSVPFHQGGIDKWGGFKAERKNLLDFLREEKIRDVVVLSADLHAAADLSDERTGVREFLVGPLAAPMQPVTSPNARTRDNARPGSYVGDAYNFGLIRVIHRDGIAMLAYEVVDARNQVRYRREIGHEI